VTGRPEWSAEEIFREISIERAGGEIVLTWHGEPVGAIRHEAGVYALDEPGEEISLLLGAYEEHEAIVEAVEEVARRIVESLQTVAVEAI
jgi:hypothetical protein